MTENKRFAVTQTTLGSGIYDYQVENELCESYDEDAYGKVVRKLNELAEENKELKASLYAEKTNTAEVVNDYAKQFKRHYAQFSFMIDLAEDLGVDVRKLEALDD